MGSLMANVVHRTTKEFRRSVNTLDFDVGTWIINPDLSTLVGVPSKYWEISGDVVSAMNQAAKDAVDAADTATAVTADKVSQKSHLDDNVRWQSLFVWLAGNTQTTKTAGEIQTDIEDGIDS